MKKILFSVTAFLLMGGGLFGISEVLLRNLKDVQPWKYRATHENEPKILVYDSVLGWTVKKGSYFISAYSPEGQDINMTYISDGIRYTGPNSVDAEKKGEFVVVGCSFTQGWAISDNETYTWKLQERFPSVKVINYGIGAYGTYQSLLVLEREMPKMKSPLIVLYGLLDDHEVRNVAPAHWLEELSKNSARGHISVPFATLDADSMLIRHPSESHPTTPLREYSSTITYLERLFVKFKARGRHEQGRQVTEKLILEMKKTSENYGAQFVVAILWSTDFKQDYIKFLQKNNIQFVDCSRRLTPDMKVPGEGHPNGQLNYLWAECISNSLEKHLVQ